MRPDITRAPLHRLGGEPPKPDYEFVGGGIEDWCFSAVYADTLDGLQVVADLYLSGIAPAATLTLANGGIVAIDDDTIDFKVAAELNIRSIPDTDYVHHYRTRVIVRATDALGNRRIIRIVTIRVCDPRTCNPLTIPCDQTGAMMATGLRGFAGPAVAGLYVVQFMRAMEAAYPGSCELLSQTMVPADQGDPRYLAWFRQHLTLPGDQFEQLVLAWIQTPAPAMPGDTGGLGITDLTEASAQLLALRVAAARQPI